MAENLDSLKNVAQRIVTEPRPAQAAEKAKPAAPKPEPDTAETPREREPRVAGPELVRKNTEVRFSASHDHQIVIKVVDKDSGEVLTTIPPLAEQLAKLGR